MSKREEFNELLDVFLSSGKKNTPVERYVAGKQIEKLVSARLKEISEKAVSSVQSEGGRSIALDHLVTTRVSRSWDYSANPEHDFVNKRKKEIEKLMKQAAETESEMSVEGEIIPPAKIKSESVSLIVK
jgi:hypothetical protein